MQTVNTPAIGNWYQLRDSGVTFSIVAIDDDDDTIDVQYFDGDLDEFSHDEWLQLDVEAIDEPEDFSGSVDIANADDLGGTNVTDTAAEDWRGLSREEPMRDQSGAEIAARDAATPDSSDDIENSEP